MFQAGARGVRPQAEACMISGAAKGCGWPSEAALATLGFLHRPRF